MRSLRLLLYPQRVNLLRLNELRHTRDRKEKLRLGWTLAAFAIAVPVLPFYGYLLAQGLYTSGMADAMIMYASALSALLALAVSVVYGYAALFGRRDTDLVGALPFSQRAVALSRLLPMYLSALVSTGLMMAPAAVFHLIAFGAKPGTVATLAALLVLTPMLPTALGLVLTAAIAWIGTRFRQKNLVISVLGILATGGIVLGSQLLQTRAMVTQDLRTLAEAVRAPLRAMYPPSMWADAALKPAGFLPLVWFALVNVLPLALAAYVLGSHYFALHDRVTVAGRSKQTAHIASAPRAALRTLIIKELRGLLGRPMYMLNSCIGLCLGPILLFGMPLFMPNEMAAITQQPEIRLLAKRMAPVLLSVFLAMMSTTSVSVSLEGAAAWLMCTCPVPPGIIYKSKLYTFLVLALPAAALSALAALLILPMNLLEVLSVLLLPAAVCLWMGVVGLRLDVRFRRFTFKNETVMVKQSVQTLLTMVAGFATLFAIGGLVYISGSYAVYTSLGCAAALAALSILLFRPLETRRMYLVD